METVESPRGESQESGQNNEFLDIPSWGIIISQGGGLTAKVRQALFHWTDCPPDPNHMKVFSTQVWQ